GLAPRDRAHGGPRHGGLRGGGHGARRDDGAHPVRRADAPAPPPPVPGASGDRRGPGDRAVARRAAGERDCRLAPDPRTLRPRLRDAVSDGLSSADGRVMTERDEGRRLTRRGLRISGLGLAGLAAVYLVALRYTPVERFQGLPQKIFYLHVPAAWSALLAFSLVGIAGALYLWRRDPRLDLFAESIAEAGLVFSCVMLPTGPASAMDSAKRSSRGSR